MYITENKEEFKKDFIDLNMEWITRYFTPEKEDYEVLENVDSLLASGGMIYCALEDGRVLAVCMTAPLENGVWEICKLAALGQYTGKGAGSAVFCSCMDYAIAHGAKKLTLISNRILKPALHIYRKCGFQETALDKSYWGLERADIAFEYLIPNEKI